MRKLVLFLVSFSVMLGILVVTNKDTNPTDLKQRQSEMLELSPDSQSKITLQLALQKIERSELEVDLRYLCSPALEGRMSGMRGNDTAATWIYRKFTTWGLNPSLQAFSVRALNENIEKSSGKSNNIIGMLLGNDPILKNEVIVVGAHMDHIGYGPAMSQAASRREIHPGADDNASGTTALLAIAKTSSLLKGQNRRTIFFVAFSGEEMGLYGAKHFVNNANYGNIVFMLNMDMVGRYNNKGVLNCLGADSSPDVKRVCEGIQGYPFTVNCTSNAGGSDHVPFYQKNIPICFLHTGQHKDYHTPDDTPDKIDYNGLVLVTKFATNIVWEIDRLDKRPSFKGVIFKDDGIFSDHDFKR